MMIKPIGLYLHVPFCRSKCPYCDFYSLRGTPQAMDAYTHRMVSSLFQWGSRLTRPADTLYLGGGTPSFLGGERIARLVGAAREAFESEPEEITVECNPSAVTPEDLERLAEAGVNRISLGMQSAVDTERRALGRLANAAQVKQAVQWARQTGIENISLDLMVGIPRQTMETLDRSLDFCLDLQVPHLSAYLLKIEEGTPFAQKEDVLELPEEDLVCDLYLHLAERMNQAGLPQYEISNFARPGWESRHNLKYWNGEEYLGLGPSAHAFLEGKRFYFSPSLEDFLQESPPLWEGEGGDPTEYAMLRLRLTEGLSRKDYQTRFETSIPESIEKKALRFARSGWMTVDEAGIRFTPTGFLLSNTLLSELLL